MSTKTIKIEKKVTAKESSSYALYFVGQNIFYMLIYMYMNTYFTDIGISAVAVAGIALIVKVWDAINDPIFGALMDKIKFKKGKFVPWLRISLIGIPLSTILLFAIPTNISPVLKIVWAVIAYMLWDTSYTLCDVPIFGLVTTITDVQTERTSLNAIGRVSAMIASLLVIVIIPTFRGMLGGWAATVTMLAVIGAIAMLPICFTAKERVIHERPEGQPDVSVKQILSYFRQNKFLMLFYAALLATGALNIASTWGLYIARYCLQNESVQSLIGLLGIVPMIFIGAFVPAICKRVDKFKLYYIATACALVANIVKYFVGYGNFAAYMVMSIICCIPAAFTTVLMYMFTPDCAEYGHFKSGISMPGITFATQTFFIKMQSAIVTALGALVLAGIGFISGEGATQAAGFTDKLWFASCIFPIVGIIISLIILRLYKLNDHDVQIMAQCNNGDITREEAQAQMKNQY